MLFLSFIGCREKDEGPTGNTDDPTPPGLAETADEEFVIPDGIRVVAERPKEAIGSIDVKQFDPKNTLTEFNVAESIGDMNGVHLTIGGKGESNLRI